MGLNFCLLTYSTSLDVVFDRFLHPNPPIVLLNFSECFVPSWVSSHGGIMCLAYYCSLHFLYIWNNDLPFWGMENADLLG